MEPIKPFPFLLLYKSYCVCELFNHLNSMWPKKMLEFSRKRLLRLSHSLRKCLCSSSAAARVSGSSVREKFCQSPRAGCTGKPPLRRAERHTFCFPAVLPLLQQLPSARWLSSSCRQYARGRVWLGSNKTLFMGTEI